MSEFPLIFAFLTGLASSLHCLGMCGGIVGALTASLPVSIRGQQRRLLLYQGLYNVSRLFSYALAGALVAGVGHDFFLLLSPQQGHVIMAWLAGLSMIAVGFYLSGWFPKFAMVEHAGRPLWRLLEPVGKRLLPVDSVYKAWAFGLVWGWMPCGLVYAAVVYSVSTGGALNGALFMLCFGLGTLPSMLTTGMLSAKLVRIMRQPRLRFILGLLIIVIGLLSLVMASHMGEVDHAGHFRGFHLH